MRSMASNNWGFSDEKVKAIKMEPNGGDTQTKVYNPWTTVPKGFSLWYPNKSAGVTGDKSEGETKVNPQASARERSEVENEESVVVQYVKLCPDAKIPKRMSPGAAGHDLYSVTEHCIAPMSKEEVSIGLQIQLPANTYGRIAPRSGLASQNFVHVGAGVIDRDFRGCISVLLFNFSASPFFVCKGDRIAQLIIERNAQPVFIEADSSLDSTSRGFAGRGSTGRR